MKKSILRIPTALFLGIVVLILSNISMFLLSKNTSILDNFPILQKSFTHTAFIIFSVLIILLINRGKLTGYGFKWSMNFPLIKLVIISILFGLASTIISMLLPESETTHPAASFSILEKILYIWIWASIAEEILCRGLIQGFLFPLRKSGFYLLKYFISIPVLVGALFFGLMHFALLSIGMNIFLVINIVIFGIILGLIAGFQRERTNSLIPAFIVHLCFNVGGSIIGIL